MTSLSQEEIEALEEGMVVIERTKGTYLVKEGQVFSDTFFVLKGCVRQYSLKDGDEKTTNFFTENQWIIPLNELAGAEPLSYNLVCMEDTELVVGNESQAQELFSRFPHFETLARTAMEKTFAEQRKLMLSFQTDTPEERYLNLMRSRPDLLQRVPQYHIASYIGVQPESLSRIRKRMSSKH